MDSTTDHSRAENLAYLNRVQSAYIEAMDFTDLDDPDRDEFHGRRLAPQTLDRIRAACIIFIAKARPILDDAGVSPEQAGHDFWLTRNGHGAGFWVRNLGEAGDALTAIAHSFGESTPYVGDDGRIYLDD